MIICLDYMTHGMSIGWGRAMDKMLSHGTRFAWGPCMLAHLYHDLHQFVYLGGCEISAGVTLLQIWAYKHITMIRLICYMGRGARQSYVHMYSMLVSKHWLGKMDYWGHVIDDIDIVIWQPYLDCEPWEEGETNLPYYYQTRCLIGRTTYIIERNFVDSLSRQFNRVQG